MTTQNTALPITNINDNVDVRVNEFFSTQFSPKGKFTDNDYELVKSFCIRRTPNEQAAAALIAGILDSINELNLYAHEVISKFESTDPRLSVPLLLNSSRSGSSLLGYVNVKQVPARVSQQVKAE